MGSVLSIVGLFLDIIGAYGVYKYHIGQGKGTEQTPTEKYKKYSKYSFYLILIGFFLQMLGILFVNVIPEMSTEYYC